MTRHDDTVALRHMRDHAVEAVAMARGRTRADLDRDRQFSLALLKLVEIVGEAANRVSRATQEANPQIPWATIVGTRNRLIHGYETVDHMVLWDIVMLDLPPLITQLQTVVPDESKP
jgi:uncharacterized protein with HEPN domain